MSDTIRTDETTFEGRFRAAMSARGLTQRGVADALGLESATQISHWATGRRRPSSANMRELAAVLDVDERWLGGEEDAGVRRASDTIRATRIPGMDLSAYNNALADQVEAMPGAEAADYLSALAKIFEVSRLASIHGWVVDLRITADEDRDIKVTSGSGVARDAAASELEQELEKEAQRLETQRSAGDEVKPARRRRGQAS